MPGADGIPGAGYGRARTGAVCARDGPQPGAAGIGLPADADEEHSRALVPGSGALLRKASAKKAPGNSGCGRLPVSLVPGKAAAGALWPPAASSLGLCSGQAHNGHQGS